MNVKKVKCCAFLIVRCALIANRRLSVVLVVGLKRETRVNYLSQ
jgi:hypothetical protein